MEDCSERIDVQRTYIQDRHGTVRFIHPVMIFMMQIEAVTRQWQQIATEDIYCL